MGFSRSDGFALPSVLFLVVILTTLALSVLSIAFLEKKLAMRQVFEVQAEYAAQSGIAMILSDYSGKESPVGVVERRYAFPDSSSAHARLQPWGALLLAESIGISHIMTSRRQCLVGQDPSPEFRNAMILGNSNHALVMTGTSRIIGDVLVGKPGVSAASLKDYLTPAKIPISGKIKKTNRPELPRYSEGSLSSQITMFDSFLRQEQIAAYEPQIVNVRTLNMGTISDSTRLIVAMNDVALTGSINRTSPLYLVTNGTTVISPRSSVVGLVAILSRKHVAIAEGARFDNALLYSQDSITVETRTPSSAQLIAPVIRFTSQAVLHYPSYIISAAGQTSLQQRIDLSNPAKVEGMVLMTSDVSASPEEQLIVLGENSTITGGIFSTGSVTLDGRVYGSALLHDLYFYEAPTQYVGWMRRGSVERDKLPQGFIVPVGMGGWTRLGVLEWL